MVSLRSLLHACALGCRRTDKTRSGRRWRGLLGVLLVWNCVLAYLATPSMLLSHPAGRVIRRRNLKFAPVP